MDPIENHSEINREGMYELVLLRFFFGVATGDSVIDTQVDRKLEDMDGTICEEFERHDVNFRDLPPSERSSCDNDIEFKEKISEAGEKRVKRLVRYRMARDFGFEQGEEGVKITPELTSTVKSLVLDPELADGYLEGINDGYHKYLEDRGFLPLKALGQV